MVNYAKAKNDLLRWMREDQRPEARFTTMFDLYGLPPEFPGFAEAHLQPTSRARVEMLEDAFAADVRLQNLGERFIPYIQLHEFEALLLADAKKLEGEFIEQHDAILRLVEECAQYGSPEDINDGDETAPSKRIISRIPSYEGRKASAGPNVVASIGIELLRVRCPHFASWLGKLEALR